MWPSSGSCFASNTAWFKKVNSISYVYISWTIHDMWMSLCCIVAICPQLTLLHGCALCERSSGGIWKFRTSSFKCYVDHSHTMYSSGNINVRNRVHLFESRCILYRHHNQCTDIKYEVLNMIENTCSNICGNFFLNHIFKTQYFIFVYWFWYLCNKSFVKHLPEDGHKRWPKHVGGSQHL